MSVSDEIEVRIREAAEAAGATAVGVSVHDLADGAGIDVDGDRRFHAASTIKLAVLVGLFDTLGQEGVNPEARVHVRNQFTSLADGRYFRVSPARDGNQDVHGHVGRTMRVRDLARHMIVTSSNLATNVLVELLGLEGVQGALDRLGVEGIDFRRGVEDERAWEAGINNRVTARGLVELLRLIAEEEAVSPEASREMLDILHDQRFVSGIPAGLPDDARVANKTGEISTVAHDAGVVYLPDREPYVIAILTEWEGNGEIGRRRALIADISRLVLERLGSEAAEDRRG
jgi:beta-lactamase class A